MRAESFSIFVVVDFHIFTNIYNYINFGTSYDHRKQKKRIRFDNLSIGLNYTV
jgi:hypothetical protein